MLSDFQNSFTNRFISKVVPKVILKYQPRIRRVATLPLMSEKTATAGGMYCDLRYFTR